MVVTALHLASARGSTEVVKLLLLLNNASKTIKNNNNQTALDVANSETIRQLLSPSPPIVQQPIPVKPPAIEIEQQPQIEFVSTFKTMSSACVGCLDTCNQCYILPCLHSLCISCQQEYSMLREYNECCAQSCFQHVTFPTCDICSM